MFSQALVQNKQYHNYNFQEDRLAKFHNQISNLKSNNKKKLNQFCHSKYKNNNNNNNNQLYKTHRFKNLIKLREMKPSRKLR